MDTVPSSFIPHDTAQSVSAPSVSRERSLSIFSDLFVVISIVLCGVSLATAAGVFLYVQYLDTARASKLHQLELAKESLEPALIAQLTRLDDRMSAADEILAAHTAPAAFFDALSLSTLQTVSFGSLNFSLSETKHLDIKMIGVAQSVNSIALQAQLFSKNGVIANPIFSGISRQQDGVHFNLTASVNPSSIQFAQVIAGGMASTAPASAAPTQTQSSSSSPFDSAANNQNAAPSQSAPRNSQ